MVTNNYILIINVNLNTARDIKEFVNMLFFAKVSLEDFLLDTRKGASGFENIPVDMRSLLKLREFVRNVVLELDNRCTMTIEELNKNEMSMYSFSFMGDEAFSFQTLCEFILQVLINYNEQNREGHPDLKYFEDVFDRFTEFLITANPFGGGNVSEEQLEDYASRITNVNKMDFDRDFPSLQYDKELFPDIIYDKNDDD